MSSKKIKKLNDAEYKEFIKELALRIKVMGIAEAIKGFSSFFGFLILNPLIKVTIKATVKENT